MKLRILSLIIALLACSFIVSTGKVETLEGTLVRKNCADPCLLYEDGCFYLTMTGYSRVAVIKDTELSKLTSWTHPTSENIVYDSADDPSVQDLFGDGALINGTWSPEIHYFSEEEFPEHSGWYMYLALKQKCEDSRNIRMVVLKSSSGRPDGPYVNPQTGKENSTQPFLNPDGKVINNWSVGPSLLHIPSGRYKGTYLMWIEEEGRGMGYGKFFQKIMISKISTPWKLEGKCGLITVPTQEWEFRGSGKTQPIVVEGATAVYGDGGEIFLTYSGSGFWSDYGLGQLTLRCENDDYADPLKTESWLKYEGNPIFSSVGTPDLRGAGHATFIKDAEGKRFFCYHAYPFENGKKGKERNAYIEPYSIDYSNKCPTAPFGVLKMGIQGNGLSATVSTKIIISR